MVINAGMMDLNFVPNQKESIMQQTLDINIYHYVALFKLLTPLLLKRGKKTGLIAVSSVISAVALPGFLIYASTKAFVNQMVYALRKEIPKSDVDILCSMPAITKTNILNNI